MIEKLALTWFIGGAGVVFLLGLAFLVWPALRQIAAACSLVWLAGNVLILASAGVYAVWRDL